MKVYKELYDSQDFEKEFEYELKDLHPEAIEILFDSIDQMEMEMENKNDISDYIRFQVQILSSSELINDYNHIEDMIKEAQEENSEDLTNEEIKDLIEEYLNDNTYLHGYYEEDDTYYFVFDEF